MNDSTPDVPTGWSPLMIGGVLLGGVILLLLLIPTFRSPSSNSDSAGSNDGTTSNGDDVSRSQCERWLTSALDGLQPARLGMSSEDRVMADTLNSWMTQCVGEADLNSDGRDAELRQSLLTPEGFERSQGERFQPRDADHIRNTLLARAIVERVTTDMRTDRERALALFYFVVRTLDLTPDDGPDMLLTPYESLLYGVGSAADRAWTYALLMRQLRLDVVMIQPRQEKGTPYWLLGVIVPGEGVLLLDTRLGLPIMVESEMKNPQTPLPMKVATLAQVRENDGLLRQFDRADRKYPLSAGDFATVDVFGIGTSSALAPRMRKLQAELPETIDVYEGLTANELRENGLIDRLVAAGSDGLWSAEQVHIWPYPEQHWNDASEQTDEQRQTLKTLAAALSGPYTVKVTMDVSDTGELSFGTVVDKSQMTLRRSRIEQLMGNFTPAQQGYLQARLKHVDVRQVQTYAAAAAEAMKQEVQDPQQLQAMLEKVQQSLFQQVDQVVRGVPELESNAIASNFATYWAAQAQYDQRDYRAAAESLMAFIQRSGGNLAIPTSFLASISLAQDGRPADAATVLAQQPPQVPQWLGNQALVERWRRLNDPNYKTDDKPVDKPVEKADDKPADKAAAPATTEEPPDKDEPAETPKDEPAAPAEESETPAPE